ncbi:hypothetical protein DENIS_1595 [Desulfonema ishimotonii]|uniref:CopG family transcriptional regulator n=1 Tax=Desulfonema ishimotonii TaxID=45657 RepID=A0A401FUL5_9BACT|nr:hypothetical protein [Desulfonema ishimotonii]GBC60638.1 hypothetical protein DENIS_1595 [Desulfonema ishimotonii]
MARTKYHITPESGRISVTLTKRQLKEFKKMSIEFETSVDELMQIAVDTFIKRYQTTKVEDMDKKGIDALS